MSFTSVSLCIDLNTANCHDPALWLMVHLYCREKREVTSLFYFYTAALFWASYSVQKLIQTCSDFSTALCHSYWYSQTDKQVSMGPFCLCSLCAISEIERSGIERWGKKNHRSLLRRAHTPNPTLLRRGILNKFI